MHADYTGGPAFPFGQISETTGQPINGCFSTGMSIRDYFAGQALAGWLASFGPDCGVTDPVPVARFAYEMADAMIAERAKEAK